MEIDYDVVVIGGGINGCGIANEASQRGLSVFLCEKNALAGETSSYSTKLIHGGLRYLEQYEFSLVRKALLEREVLLNIAPHLVSPLEFILPHSKKVRPAWLIRLGLFIYDHLSTKNTLKSSRSLSRSSALLKPLQNKYTKGFSYYDCQVNDARLAISNAIQAHNCNAVISTYTTFIEAECLTDYWKIKLVKAGREFYITCKCIINATGPWVSAIDSILNINPGLSIQWVKGSHILVDRLYQGKQAYILQNDDQRIIFAIPYLNDFTMIGTTEVAVDTIEGTPHISAQEVNYLLASTNSYFQHQLASSDIKHSFSGIRPLVCNQNTSLSKITRDYSIEISNHSKAPIISIYGGKLTTYRILAKQTIDKLSSFFPALKKSQTHLNVLPGGDYKDLKHLKNRLQKTHPWLLKELVNYYCQHYGSLSFVLLKGKTSVEDLGQQFSSLLYELEILYLYQHEWVKDTNALLFKNTKHGYFMQPQQIEDVGSYLQKIKKSIPLKEI